MEIQPQRFSRTGVFSGAPPIPPVISILSLSLFSPPPCSSSSPPLSLSPSPSARTEKPLADYILGQSPGIILLVPHWIALARSSGDPYSKVAFGSPGGPISDPNAGLFSISTLAETPHTICHRDHRLVQGRSRSRPTSPCPVLDPQRPPKQNATRVTGTPPSWKLGGSFTSLVNRLHRHEYSPHSACTPEAHHYRWWCKICPLPRG